MEFETYRKFFDEFSKWRSQDAGVGLDHTVLIDASGSMLEETTENVTEMYNNDNMWIKEQIHDFQQECGNMPDKPRKIDLAKFAAWVLIDRVHEESRKDSCMIGSFGQQLDTCKRQTPKAVIKKHVCEIRVQKRAPTRLWASIYDILKDMSKTKAGPLKLKHAIIFTDGCDNLSCDESKLEIDKSRIEGYESEFDCINKDNKFRKDRNVELAQEFVLDYYKKMNDDGIENPPRLKIVAIDPSGELSSLWAGVENACNNTIYPFPVVQIEAYARMDSVIEAFMKEKKR